MLATDFFHVDCAVTLQRLYLYRFKTYRTASGLVIHGFCYAAWWYSLITPPGTFVR